MSEPNPYSALSDALSSRPYVESEQSFRRDITNRFYAFFEMIEKFNKVTSDHNSANCIKANIANVNRVDRTAIGWIDITHHSGSRKLLFTLHNSEIAIQDDDFMQICSNRRYRFHIDEVGLLESEFSKFLIQVYTDRK